jgi:hypothetical protein
MIIIAVHVTWTLQDDVERYHQDRDRRSNANERREGSIFSDFKSYYLEVILYYLIR